jgi:hypothetical protein
MWMWPSAYSVTFFAHRQEQTYDSHRLDTLLAFRGIKASGIAKASASQIDKLRSAGDPRTPAGQFNEQRFHAEAFLSNNSLVSRPDVKTSLGAQGRLESAFGVFDIATHADGVIRR